MEKVDIVCTSDTHGMLDKVISYCFGGGIKASPKILVFAGDIAPAEFGVNASDYIRDVFIAMAKNHPDTEVVYTPGNHDFFAQQWDKFEKDAPSNLHFLLDSGCEIHGLKFYGSPWVPYINGGWAFECEDEDELGDRFNLIPKNVDILVTHSPPRIKHKKIDVSMQFKNGSRPFGSTALFDAIKEKRPRYLICGHIHSGDHSCIDIEHEDGSATHCLNVSHVDERYSPSYSPTALILNTNNKE